MSAMRDADLLIKAYLAEGVDELPDRSYDAIRAVVDETRQWRVVGRWTEPQLINGVRSALMAAAIVLAVVVVIRFVPSTIIGPEPTATPTAIPSTVPSASPGATPTTYDTINPLQTDSAAGAATAQPLPTSPYTRVVYPGRYVTTDTVTNLPVSFSMPTGWLDMQGVLVLGEQPNVFENRAAFSTWIVDRVYSDACNWSGTATPVITANDMVNVLSQQSGRQEAPPETMNLGGVPATLIVLSVSPSFDETGCDGGIVSNWPDAVGATRGGWRSIAGQSDSVYVVDSPAGALVITASVMPNGSQADKDALAAVVQSIRIGSN